MIRPLVIWIAIGLSGMTAGCVRQNTAGERSPAEVTFRARCQTCHRLPDVADRSADEWRKFLVAHSRRAGLDSAKTDSVLVYLTGDGRP